VDNTEIRRVICQVIREETAAALLRQSVDRKPPVDKALETAIGSRARAAGDVACRRALARGASASDARDEGDAALARTAARLLARRDLGEPLPCMLRDDVARLGHDTPPRGTTPPIVVTTSAG